MSFSSLGLAPELVRVLDRLGYQTPTDIQERAIPLALEGHDLLAAAQTGTGKTAAFSLPVLQRLQQQAKPKGPRSPRALILTPTRELALQVHDNLRNYAKGSGLTSTLVFGGVRINPQIRALQRGVDVLVATPGRLLDHAGQRTVDLSQVQTLVLDEADRMLDMGFLPAIRRILGLMPRENRQTLLFSATFAPEIRKLAQQFLRDPVEVKVAPDNSVVPTVEHRAHPVDQKNKRNLLLHLLAEDSRRQTLVFTRTKHGANRLSRELEQAGLTSAAIHGNKSQNARIRALDGFKQGKITVLVATDIAARGIDIEDLPMVVNFDLPNVAEDYVHRIGRTGRNGRKGEAISLVAPEEGPLLREIQHLLKQPLDVIPVAGFEASGPLQMDGSLKNARGGNRGRNSSGRQRRPRAECAPPTRRPGKPRRNPRKNPSRQGRKSFSGGGDSGKA